MPFSQKEQPCKRVSKGSLRHRATIPPSFRIRRPTGITLRASKGGSRRVEAIMPVRSLHWPLHTQSARVPPSPCNILAVWCRTYRLVARSSVPSTEIFGFSSSAVARAILTSIACMARSVAATPRSWDAISGRV
jgi:hypothetical protein